MHNRDVRVAGGEPLSDSQSIVGGGVVGDDDRPAVGEVGLQVGAEGRYALWQSFLLVVDGDDDLDADLPMRQRTAMLGHRYSDHEVQSFLCWVLYPSPLSLDTRAMIGL